jgi:prepilin-type N-terminal cleavage/methylation domain-containing protein
LGTRGFTLVELIVAMTVSLIVIGITTALLLSGTNMAQHTTQRALEEQIVDGAFNYAEKQLRFAGTVEKLPASSLNSLPANGGALYTSGNNGASAQSKGALCFKQGGTGDVAPVNVLGDQFYMGYTVSLVGTTLIHEVGKKPVVTLTVTLYDRNGTKMTERKRSITLINGAAGTTDSVVSLADADLLYYGAKAGTP